MTDFQRSSAATDLVHIEAQSCKKVQHPSHTQITSKTLKTHPNHTQKRPSHTPQRPSHSQSAQVTPKSHPTTPKSNNSHPSHARVTPQATPQLYILQTCITHPPPNHPFDMGTDMSASAYLNLPPTTNPRHDLSEYNVRKVWVFTPPHVRMRTLSFPHDWGRYYRISDQGAWPRHRHRRGRGFLQNVTLSMTEIVIPDLPCIPSPLTPSTPSLLDAIYITSALTFSRLLY